MLNFNPEAAIENVGPEERIDIKGIKSNWRSIEKHLDFFLNNIYVNASEVEQFGSSLSFIGTYPVIGLQHGVNSSLFYTVLRPIHWISGNIQFTIYYIGTVSDNTKQIQIEIVGRASNVGTLLTGAAVFDQTYNVQSPGTLNIQTEFSPLPGSAASNTMPIDSTSDLINIQVRRIGTNVSDTYIGNMAVIGVRITYLPNYVSAHF